MQSRDKAKLKLKAEETYRSVPYDLVGNFVVLQRPPDLHTMVKSCQAEGMMRQDLPWWVEPDRKSARLDHGVQMRCY